jgi:hypothetical protein
MGCFRAGDETRSRNHRTTQGETSVAVRYFLGSRRADAAAYGPVLRGHGGIEHGLQWQMDINFEEDASRTQRQRGAENFAVRTVLPPRTVPRGLARRRPGHRTKGVGLMVAVFHQGLGVGKDQRYERDTEGRSVKTEG